MSQFLGAWDCIAKLDRTRDHGGKWSNKRESNSFVGWCLSAMGPLYTFSDKGASGREIQGKGDLITGGRIMRLWGIPGDYVLTCMIMNGKTIEFEDGSSKTVGEPHVLRIAQHENEFRRNK